MIRAMRTAASGMYAQKLNVDNITNNLANVNTPGYKRSRIEFQDLLYQTVRPAGSETLGQTESPTELQVGCGTRPVATLKMYSQGEIIETGNPLDLAVLEMVFSRFECPMGPKPSRGTVRSSFHRMGRL